jgi:hypothetical protein
MLQISLSVKGVFKILFLFRTEQERLQEFVKQKGINIAKSDKSFVRFK